MEAAASALERIKTGLKNLDFAASTASVKESRSESEKSLAGFLVEAQNDFVAALADDLNTPDALAVIFKLVYQVNLLLAEAEHIKPDRNLLEETAALIRELMAVLGFDLKEEAGVPLEVMEKVEARKQAKKVRDFALADALRDEVTALGYKIEDTPQGPQVSKL